jgi:hypothetical protein
MADVESVVLAYARAWNERDPERRREWISSCWSPTATLIAPQARYAGREALEADIAKFHREMPGYRGILISGIDAHNEYVRFRARVLDPEGRTVSEGTDIGEIGPDGLFTKIITFWGPPPPVVESWPADLIC